MKVNRQYKHHLSCTLHYHRRPYRQIPVRRHFTVASLEMPQPSPTTLRTDSSPSAFHSNVPGNATTITDTFADGYQSVGVPGNTTTITDDFADAYQSVGIVSACHNYRQNHRRTVRISKGGALNAF